MTRLTHETGEIEPNLNHGNDDSHPDSEIDGLVDNLWLLAGAN
jgi:hypothetical protein